MYKQTYNPQTYNPQTSNQCYGQSNHQPFPASNAGQQQFQNQMYEEPISVFSWLILLIVTCIPVVGVCYLLYLALGSSVRESKRNYARASILLGFIAFFILVSSSCASYILF